MRLYRLSSRKSSGHDSQRRNRARIRHPKRFGRPCLVSGAGCNNQFKVMSACLQRGQSQLCDWSPARRRKSVPAARRRIHPEPGRYAKSFWRPWPGLTVKKVDILWFARVAVLIPPAGRRSPYIDCRAFRPKEWLPRRHAGSNRTGLAL